MCPANYTTLADGSVDCDTPVRLEFRVNRAVTPISRRHLLSSRAVPMAQLAPSEARWL
jgi:hypothetical protein